MKFSHSELILTNSSKGSSILQQECALYSSLLPLRFMHGTKRAPAMFHEMFH